jgi:hypothetical protein
MEGDPQIPHRNPVSRLVHKIGEMAGVVRPDWMDQEVWDERTEAELRLIRSFHDHGTKRFRVLRSAEVGIKHYTRPPKGN